MVILQKKVAGLSRISLERFVLRARRALDLRGRVDVLVTSNAAIRLLNRQFRNQNKATDVLSFPSGLPREKSRKKSLLVGEIVISADYALQNAHRLGHSPAIEVKVLTLHGLLHLAGFDHERDNGAMARKEEQMRRVFRLPVALIERVHTGRGKSLHSRRAERTRGRRTA